VSFGAGSATTLTPEDGEAILRECPAIRSEAPVVRARTQVVYGSRNWVPSSMYGTTPAFLDVREWTSLEEGEAFTDRDVLNGTRDTLERRVSGLGVSEPLIQTRGANQIVVELPGVEDRRQRSTCSKRRAEIIDPQAAPPLGIKVSTTLDRRFHQPVPQRRRKRRLAKALLRA
jgi:preprotein translocase subunit SecD